MTLYSPPYAPPALPHFSVAPVSREAADASTPPMLKQWREIKARHPRRDPVLPDGRLLRDVLRGRRARCARPRHHAHLPGRRRAARGRAGEGGRRVPAAARRRGAPGRDLRAGRGPEARQGHGAPRGGGDGHARRDAAGRLAAGRAEQLDGGDRLGDGTGASGSRPSTSRPASSCSRPCRGDGLAEALERLGPAEVVVPADAAAPAGRWRRCARRASAGSSTPTSRARSWPDGSQLATLDGLGIGPRGRAGPRRCGRAAALPRRAAARRAAAPRAARPSAGATRYLWLDEMTRRNLELVEPLAAGARARPCWKRSTARVTPMGGRLLRQWLLSPLRDPAAIEDGSTPSRPRSRWPRRARLREALDGVRDLERLAGRARRGRATPARAGGPARLVPPAARRAEALTALAGVALPEGGAAGALADCGRRARPAARPRRRARPRARPSGRRPRSPTAA